MIINFNLIISSMPSLLHGLAISLAISCLSCLLGLLGGIPLGILLTTSSVMRYPAALYVLLVRGTPLLIQILFVTYGLPQVGIYIPLFWAAVLAIGLNSAAYVSQIVRAGINAVGTGQLEAARVVGLSSLQTMRYIVLPQAVRIALPAFGSEFVNLVKESSLASVVGIAELTRTGQAISGRTLDAISVYVGVALCYLLVTSLVSFFVHLIERQANYHAKN